MSNQVGVVVTDGRVLLGNEVEEQRDLKIIPREVRVGDDIVRSDERIGVVRSLAREWSGRGRPPQVLPPQREHFLRTYQQLAEAHDHVISVHYLATLDGAAREARICRQLMQPAQQIDVYEAKTLEGGLEFLLQTALSLLEDGASATQLLALLRYLETHMLTFLLVPGVQSPQPWVKLSGLERTRSLMPASETAWLVDPKQGKFTVAAQGIGLHSRLGTLIQKRWGTLRYKAVLRYRGYQPAQMERLSASLQAAGVAELPRLERVSATFLPCLPKTFAEVLLLPTEADLARLRGLVQDPIWWKGDA